MKSRISYWLIGLFGVWCAVASKWYLSGIKGLQVDPDHFRPHETMIGIIEIIAILLVTVLLGFGIAWFLRQSAIEGQEVQIKNLQQAEKKSKEQEQEWISKIEKTESTLARAKESFKEDFSAAANENERLKEDLARAQQEAQQKQEELQMLRPKVQLADVELGRITMQFRQLEQQVKEHTDMNQALTNQLNQLQTESKTIIDKPEVAREARTKRLEKDDLKLIVGIGPKIEKKLNKLGLYTFEQIRDLTPEMMEHITTKLKSFPDRIGRDNWVGQAKQLIRKAPKE